MLSDRSKDGFDSAECLPLTGYLALRAQDYAHPREVLLDQDLDDDQKRAILCAWASDASAVESRPGFRWLAGTPGPVALTQVMTALQALDSQSGPQRASAASVIANAALSRASRAASSGRSA